MNNPVFRKIDITNDYQALGGDEIFTVDVSTPPTNVGLVYFKTADGVDVPWIAGEWHQFFSVKLSDILVRGTAGDIVTVIGGTW